jgi:thiamine transport system substrate-binding protein
MLAEELRMKKRSFIFGIYALLSLNFLLIGSVNADPPDQITVYATYKLPQRMASEINVFEQKQNCTINWRTFSDTPSLVMRLRLEGDASKADIILGVDTLFSESIRKFLRPLDSVKNSFQKTVDLPQDDKLQPYLLAPLCIVCRGTDFNPTSFEELLEAIGNDQFLFQDPRTSLPGLAFLAWIYHNKHPKKFWKAVSPKILTVTKGWSHSYGLFSQGQGKCIVSYASADPYHRSKNETDIHALRFERHPLQVMVTGILKSTKNPSKAQAFINFLLSQKMQKVMSLDNWMWPINAASIPETFPDIKDFNPFWIDPKKVDAAKESWIETWQENLR